MSASREDRVLEYVDHLHEHFFVVIRKGRYMPPTEPGSSIAMKPASLEAHEFPSGEVWTLKSGEAIAVVEERAVPGDTVRTSTLGIGELLNPVVAA